AEENARRGSTNQVCRDCRVEVAARHYRAARWVRAYAEVEDVNRYRVGRAGLIGRVSGEGGIETVSAGRRRIVQRRPSSGPGHGRPDEGPRPERTEVEVYCLAQ